MSDVLYERGRTSVTETLLRTRRRAYDLRRVDSVTLRQPLLAFVLVIALGMFGITWAFWTYLYDVEKAALIAAPVLAIALSSRIAVLRIHSRTHSAEDDGGQMFGEIRHLSRVKTAVETAIDQRLNGLPL
ncbi:MAG: hypothetical protein AAGF94_09120 [Pseudomonadota bacterium]